MKDHLEIVDVVARQILDSRCFPTVEVEIYLEDGTKGVKVCGRIAFARKMGKLAFVKIRNIEEAFQLEFRVDLLGEERYEFFKKLIDGGDFIGAEGEIFTTQTGEKTLRVEDFNLT